MNEHLNLIKELLVTESHYRKNEILKLITESFLLRKKYWIFSRYFDQTRKVVSDLENLKKRKTSIKSELISELIKKQFPDKCKKIDDSNFSTIERDIINEYSYYYTAFILNKLLQFEKNKSLYRYVIATLLTIISIILGFIANLLK